MTPHPGPDGAPKYTNRLAGESSPYLRKHAHNPVDWYPWGVEAFATALERSLPIHLSIGYYACHWCSVMERESFEDEQTARVLNSNFVNIKVDREERPDLDRVYQLAHQLLTSHGGGWPLTMFLTHDDHRPFFGGTYFPKEERYGMPPFQVVLERVAKYYRERQGELRQQNAALLRAFDEIIPPPADPTTALDATPLLSGRSQLASSFDREHGGLGGAPKFPHPAMLEWLLRAWHASAAAPEPDLEALYLATLTLTRMGEGGLCDQLGGGFARYSTDAQWMIPHFEKMLYDNGALLACYATAALATGDGFYARIALETAAWMLRDLRSPDGAFYSSLDADSEGHEGRFYAWDAAEAQAALTPAEWAVFAPRFGFDREPNFEGRWYPHVFRSMADVATAAGVAAAEAQHLIDSARVKLLAIRARRIAPGRDEKILTGWNAMAIRGLAIAGRALRRPDLSAAATRALDFVRATLWRDGRLLASCMDGQAHLNAYLDDYVFLADAALELLQARWRGEDLALLQALLDAVLGHFSDPAGGFFFTADDHETLIHRMKSFADDATPSGNGVAAFVLQRAGYLLGHTRYLEAAERTLRAAWVGMGQAPQAHASLLTALEEYLHAPEIVVLRGEAAVIEQWRQELATIYAPRRLVFAIPADAAALPEALASKAARGSGVAYLCRGSVCSAPFDSLAALVQGMRREPDTR